MKTARRRIVRGGGASIRARGRLPAGHLREVSLLPASGLRPGRPLDCTSARSTAKEKSVTYVLNLKCYPCPDDTQRDAKSQTPNPKPRSAVNNTFLNKYFFHGPAGPSPNGTASPPHPPQRYYLVSPPLPPKTPCAQACLPKKPKNHPDFSPTHPLQTPHSPNALQPAS